MSKRNYDSEFCGSLPLHHINLIQPYGYLLVLNKDDLTVIQASENVESLLNSPVQQIIGTSIATYIQSEELENLKHKLSLGSTDKIIQSFTFNINNEISEFNAQVHSKTNYLVVELEQIFQTSTFIDVFQELKSVISEINGAGSINEVCNVALQALKKLAGFDRVLMYKFDEDWNGTVIAEMVDESSDPYLGLKFPASDIPKQARALYLKNPYRLIPERDYTPVRLYPVINPVTNSFIDLSDCNLRSVASVHLEYMENMGIQASMSIRVIRNGQLWGLISCHSFEPKYLNYELCSVFELLSEVLSSKISAILTEEEYNYRAFLLENRSVVLQNLFTTNQLAGGLLKSGLELQKMFKAHGLSVIQEEKITSIGKTLTADEIKNLVYWLQAKNKEMVYSEANLSAAYDNALNYVEIASGLLAIPLGREGDYLLLYRPEEASVVSWGGNPDQAINYEEDGKKYHPRNSFKTWQETVKQNSLPWLRAELEIAESLRSSIFEYSEKHIYN